jgi:hypothetical protein
VRVREWKHIPVTAPAHTWHALTRVACALRQTLRSQRISPRSALDLARTATRSARCVCSVCGLIRERSKDKSILTTRQYWRGKRVGGRGK